MATILMPLPDRDFDITEAAVPWKLFKEAGHEVTFATEEGRAPAGDPLLVDGVVFGQLGAEPEPLAFYREMRDNSAYQSPRKWNDLDVDAYDALWLSGGHAPGMKQYLEGEALRDKVQAFWETDRPVAAICHGVVVLSRSRQENGRSVLDGRRTTCLPKYMERVAYFVTAWKVGRYYRTYPEYVEDEVRRSLGEDGSFERGPIHLFSKGKRDDDRAAFIVEDGRLLSGRWPGDAYLLAKRLIAKL